MKRESPIKKSDSPGQRAKPARVSIELANLKFYTDGVEREENVFCGQVVALEDWWNSYSKERRFGENG